MRILKSVVVCNILLFQLCVVYGQVNNNPTKKSANTELSPTKVLELADSLGVDPAVIFQYADSLGIRPENIIQYADSIGSGLLSLPFLNNNFGSDSTSTDSLAYIPPAGKSDIETTVDYSAADSMFFDLETQDMFLYGDAKIKYGNIELEAEKIEINWVTTTLKADYVVDSTKAKVGKPIFRQGVEEYTTDDITYNFKTKKAIIRGIITQQDGAFMHGETVKKNEKDEMFIKDAIYTTCDLAEPHYSIHSRKLKVIPKNKVVSGPFQLFFGEIPTVLAFPFGMFPQPRKKASGIIVPQYGEDGTRGFFLREGGYYFDLSDYIDLTLTGEIYSRGSYGLQSRSTYRKRYAYSGSFNLRYNKSVTGTLAEEKPFSQDFWLQWSHSPQSKGTSRFSASVSAGTSSFSQNVNLIQENYARAINAQFNSSVSYSKTFRNFNMTMNARHNQNVQSGLVNLTLPEMTLNANRVYLFKNSPKLSKSPLGKLGLSYSMTSKNDLSNAAKRTFSGVNVVNRSTQDDSVVSFSPSNLDVLLDRAKNGMRHTIPISTSFNVLKFFTVSPSFNYSEVWYPRELKYTYIPEEEGVRIDTLRGFSRAGSYSSGASVNTRLYGFYPIGGKKIQAIRHVMTPSIGFSYSPDFGDTEKFDNYQEVQINERGDTRLLSKYEGFAYGGPSRGESASMSFSLSNNIEMKVKTKNDSIDEYKKVKLFDNLAFSSGYNFAADSFKLSNISMGARTSFLKRAMTVSFNGSMDPYVYLLDSITVNSGGSRKIHDRRIDRFAWNNGDGLGKLSRGTISVGLNLSPKSKKKKKESENPNDPNQRGYDPNDLNDPNNPYSDPYNMEEGVRNGEFIGGQANKEYSIYDDVNQYVDFSIPWTLRATYSYNYSKIGFQDSRVTQALTFSGNVSLTEKTKIGINSGFDIKNRDFTVTRLNLSRDLHCWTLNFNWVPFGVNQSYFVEIRVLSTLLSDLKLDKQSRPIFRRF